MSYGEYKSIADVIQKYPLKIVNQRFLSTTAIALPDWFVENINFSLEQKTAYDSETFYCENFIYPFLQFAWKKYPRLRVWSHRALNYDNDLSGEPDYFISYWPDDVIRSLISYPLLAVVEAKKQNFDEGWGQCLAEMIACQKLNEKGQTNFPLTIYGIVSTGTVWEFGQLQGSCFTQNTLSYSLSHPELLAGILDYLFQQCEAQTQNIKTEV